MEALSSPRYRTLDGIEFDLPLYLDQWVLVPSVLARNEEELTWTLDYDDVPSVSPQMRDELGGDPALDFSEGAMLVPVERWNQQAAIEPALGTCIGSAGGLPSVPEPRRSPVSDAATRDMQQIMAPRVAAVTYAARRACAGSMRTATQTALWVVGVLLLLLGGSFTYALVEWLLTQHDGLSGRDIGNGVVLLAGAIGFSWLMGLICTACDRLRRPQPDLIITSRGPLARCAALAQASFTWGAAIVCATLVLRILT